MEIHLDGMMEIHLDDIYGNSSRWHDGNTFRLIQWNHSSKYSNKVHLS